MEKLYGYLNRQGKYFDKIQHSSLIKTLNTLRIKRNFNLIKGLCKRARDNIKLNNVN